MIFFCFIGCEAILWLLGKLFHSKVLRLGGKIWHSRGSWSESPQNHGGWKQKTQRRCSERTEWGSQGKDYFQILVSEMFVMLRVTDWWRYFNNFFQALVRFVKKRDRRVQAYRVRDTSTKLLSHYKLLSTPKSRICFWIFWNTKLFIWCFNLKFLNFWRIRV